jgi:hypothetical protein
MSSNMSTIRRRFVTIILHPRSPVIYAYLCTYTYFPQSALTLYFSWLQSSLTYSLPLTRSYFHPYPLKVRCLHIYCYYTEQEWIGMCALLRYYAASCDNCLPTFRDKSVGPIFVTLKMRPTRPETSVNNYHTTPRNTPEERRSHQHRGGSLKSRMDCLTLSNYPSWYSLPMTISIYGFRPVFTRCMRKCKKVGLPARCFHGGTAVQKSF